MKALLNLSFLFLVFSLASGCGKGQQADSGAGSNNAIPPACIPDGNGNLPSGCPVPATNSMNLSGDLLMSNENSTVPLLKDNPGRLERPWTPYSTGYPASFYTPQIRCQTGDDFWDTFTGKTCERECKNYRYGAQIQAEVFSGNGVVRFRAGPYRAPGVCDRSLNNSHYVVQIPVFLYNTTDEATGKKGFTLQSAQAYPYNKTFSIVVKDATLTEQQTTYWGDVFYNGTLMGRVQLYRRVP